MSSCTITLSWIGCNVLKSRIDGLTLKRKDTKNAFVNSTKRFLSNKSFQCFDKESGFGLPILTSDDGEFRSNKIQIQVRPK